MERQHSPKQFSVIHRERNGGLTKKQNCSESNRREKKMQSVLNPKIDEMVYKNK